MGESKTDNETGIFKLKNQPGVVLKWKGREVCRYESMEAFVEAHLKCVEALELQQEQLLSDAYKDKL